ncbi:hypothetical protein MNAN1_002611 [Malassezia nana]|uniref:Kelch repeat-containing protein n=1 Tax=Malassezia nana TaxID=180528 RepID=A0AAF0J819_9BASI|nr:hypothetical protein MNAN1_002611 [Malassezia nana]
MGRFLPLVPYAAALIAAASHTLAAPAPTQMSEQTSSSSDDSGLLGFFGTKLMGEVGQAFGAQHTSAPGTPSQDGDMAGDFMKMLGGLSQFQMPEPDMSRYSNATVAPRWGATAQYLRGSEVIAFVGGQLDDKGHVSNETLLLDMSGLNDLQSTRASVKQVPWLHFNQSHSSVSAPQAAYASSYTSTSVCGATDGHVVDTLWLVGGKTEQCKEEHVLYTYNLEKKNKTLVGTWKPIRTNGSHPTRRSHGSTVLTSSLLPNQEDVALMVWGGEDVHASCGKKRADAKYAMSMDLMFIGDPLDQQCKPPKHFAPAQVQSFAMNQELNSVPVVDYAAVQMPVIHNNKTQRDETPLLFLGGRDKSHTLVDFSQPWAMDLSSGQWVQWGTTGDIPAPRVGHSAVHTNDGRVLVYGGYKKHHDWMNVSKVPTDEMYMLDASHTPARWTKIHYRSPPKDGPRPSKRAYHSAVMVDDVLVVAFGQQHESTAFGLEKRGGTNTNASEPLVMYMDTRENIMQYRWTDKLSAIVSARVAQKALVTDSPTPTTAVYMPTSTGRASRTASSTPTAMNLPYMSRVPTPQEVSQSSASKASASKASASKASASKASASQASASKASASKASASQASATESSNSGNQGVAAQDGSNHADQNGQGDDAQDNAPDNGNEQSNGDDTNDSGDSSPSSSSSSSPSPSSDNKKDSDGSQTSSGAIAGGVIGAAALAVGAVVGGLYAYKKRRESQKIAELKSTGVLYDKDQGAPPVSSLWLQRPLRDVIDYDVPGRSSNLSGYSMRGQAGTPASLSPAGGRLMGQDDRHTVRGPRSVFPYAADTYAMDSSNPYVMPDETYAHAYMPENLESATPSSYAHFGGVQRSSGAEVTSNMEEAAESMYANSVDGQTMVHGDENGPRRSASFRFPEAQAYAPHEPSTLRVMNN